MKILRILFSMAIIMIAGNVYSVPPVPNPTWSKFCERGKPIAQCDISKLVSMLGMFTGEKYFNEPIGQWNVSNVTDMREMFFFAESFNQPIGRWNVANVTDMFGMFNGAGSFSQPIGKWNVSKVSNMEFMFAGSKSFNQDLSQWCVSQFKEKPQGFDENTPAWEEKNKLVWGTCPRGEDKKR